MNKLGESKQSEYERVPVILVALVCVFGLALRLPQISYSFYGDESFSLLRDANQFLTDSEDRFRPVFFSLLYLWKMIGFHGEVGLRLLPLLFGVAQIPFAYLVGRELRSPRLGLTFAVLIAANPMLMEFSQELRMYSMVAFIALVHVWVLLRLLNRSTDPTKSTKWLWSWFVVLSLLGVYTHLHYWILLAGMSLTFWRERKIIAWWKGWLALGVILILYLPNLPNILYFQEVRGADYQVHFASALPKLLAAFAVGFNYFKLPELGLGRPVGFSVVESNWPLFLVAIIPALLILWRWIGLQRELIRPLQDNESAEEHAARWRAYMLSFELFVVPILLSFAASAITGKYFLQPKYMIFAAPFALLLLAQIFLSFHYAALRRVLAGFGVAVLVVAFIHLNRPDDFGRRENWRHAGTVLQSELAPMSTLLLIGNGYPLLTYYSPETKEYWQDVALPADHTQPKQLAVTLAGQIADKTDIYYLWFETARSMSDPQDMIVQSLDLIAYRSGMIQFNPRLKLYHWRRPVEINELDAAGG